MFDRVENRRTIILEVSVRVEGTTGYDYAIGLARGYPVTLVVQLLHETNTEHYEPGDTTISNIISDLSASAEHSICREDERCNVESMLLTCRCFQHFVPCFDRFRSD